jgi:hypothetical protein
MVNLGEQVSARGSKPETGMNIGVKAGLPSEGSFIRTKMPASVARWRIARSLSRMRLSGSAAALF